MDRFSERLYPTRDHVHPKSQGGQITVICCRTCNNIKGDMLPAIWEAFMAAFPRWWTMSIVQLNAAKRSPFRGSAAEGLVKEPETVEHGVERGFDEIPGSTPLG
jgi:hypothetical protein